MRTRLLLLVSVVTLASGALLIFYPPNPCLGMQSMAASSCTTSTLALWYVVFGGVVVFVAIGGLIASIRAWPNSPVLPGQPIYPPEPIRVMLLVAVTAIASGLLILFPPEPCAGVQPLFAASSSCTTSGLNLAYTVWAGVLVLIGLVGAIGSLSALPDQPIRGGK
jgi:hypothetical protein